MSPKSPTDGQISFEMKDHSYDKLLKNDCVRVRYAMSRV